MRHLSLELCWSLTREARADGCLKGHFQPRHLDSWTADLARSQALACGSAAFVEAVGEQLRTRFAGLQTEPFSIPRWCDGKAPREVHLCFARSQREVSGDSTAGLLEQAEAHSLRPAHGYRQDIRVSYTCVLLGDCVHDLRSGALYSEPGQPIRLCVSAAHGDPTLDL